MIDKAVAGATTAAQNGVYATLRKSGVLKDGPNNGSNGHGAPQAPVNPTPNGSPAPTVAAIPPGFVAVGDVKRLIEQSNAVIRIASQNQLTDAQVTRMTRALDAENPDDPSAWTNSYLEDLGLKKVASPAPALPAPATPPTTLQPTPGAPQSPPISDKGPAAPGNVDDTERRLQATPRLITGADRRVLEAKYGPEKANQMIKTAFLAQGDTRVVFAVK